MVNNMKNVKKAKDGSNFYLIPLIVAAAIVPLIVCLKVVPLDDVSINYIMRSRNDK
jgi:hypothetical protein